MENFKDVKVQNEGGVDRAYIVKEATRLYKQCLAEAEKNKIDVKKILSGKPKKEDLDFLDKLFDRMQKEHKQLADTYPTVVRHMIQELQYDRSVFDEYLKGLEKSPWMNDAQRMDSYTNYAVLLYKHSNKGKHLSRTQVELFRKDYRKRLQDEHDKFIETVEEHKKQVEKEGAHYSESVKKDMIAMIKKQLAESDAGMTNTVAAANNAMEDASAAASQSDPENREQLEKLVAAGILSPSVLQ